ncbi:MAG TPA: response regulator transcription factor [Noviherbaspirillum sp.]|nr:response regulator transcription factor [Noviherbaspirillum sp.]
MRIAVLDNDRSEADLICQILSAARHTCHSFQSGTALLEHLKHEKSELLIMNWQVKDMSGSDVLRWIRSNIPPTFPTLVLANCSDEDSIVAAMAAGANDYIIKPIRRSELLTRTQVLLKLAYPELDVDETRFGKYIFDHRSGRVKTAGGVIALTQKEFELALLLFRHLGRPLSRAFIKEAIWPRDTDVPSRTVDTHVSRVRSKLGLHPENGFRLISVYSYGYRLEQLPE